MNKSDVELSDVAHETFHVRRDSVCGVPERQCTTMRSNYDGAVGHIVIEIFECPFERKSFLIIRMLRALRGINSFGRIVNRVLKTVMLLCKYCTSAISRRVRYNNKCFIKSRSLTMGNFNSAPRSSLNSLYCSVPGL